MLMVKVKSAYKPICSSGRRLSLASVAWRDQEYFYSPLDGMLSCITFAGTHLYTWVERGTVRVNKVLLKNTTQCPGIEPRSLNPGLSALAMRPPLVGKQNSLFPLRPVNKCLSIFDIAYRTFQNLTIIFCIVVYKNKNDFYCFCYCDWLTLEFRIAALAWGIMYSCCIHEAM